MADADDKATRKPKLNPADLKARLGLSQKKTVAPLAPPAPVSEAEAEAVALAAATQSEADDVAGARQRAAEAERAAGPAIEDFSVIGQESTPVPGLLPGQVEYVTVGADETYPGKDKKHRTMLILLAVGVGAIAFFVGYLLSGASLQDAVHEKVVREATQKVEMLSSHKPIHERIAALSVALKGALEKIDAAPGDEAGVAVVEAELGRLLPIFKAYVNDNIYIEPSAVLGDVVYNGALARELVEYALATEKLHQGVSRALGELTTYLPLTVPPKGGTRLVLVQEIEKPHPEQEGVGVPFSEGAWILETSPPGEVTLTHEGREIGKEWQIMVRTADDVKTQVKTTQVMDLDVTTLVEGPSKRLHGVVVGRFIELTRQLSEQADRVNPARVMEEAQKWSVAEAGAVVTK